MLDYIFYRTNKAFIKQDGKEGSTSHALLTCAIVVYLIDLFGIIFREVGIISKIPKEYNRIFVFAIVVGLLIYFYRKYRNRYDEFDKKWGKEPKRQKIWRGIGVVVFLIMPLVIGIVYIGCIGTVFGVNFLGNY